MVRDGKVWCAQSMGLRRVGHDLEIEQQLRKEGYPGSSAVKIVPTNSGGMVLIPGSGRSRGEGDGNPLQYSCLENPVERGAWCRLQSMGSQRLGHDLSDQTAASLRREPKHPGGFSMPSPGSGSGSYLTRVLSGRRHCGVLPSTTTTVHTCVPRR